MTFIIGAVMTFVWFSYGRLVDDSKLMFVNGTGFILQTIYCFVFYSFTTAKVQTGKKIFLTFLLLVLVQTYVVNEESLETAQFRIGLFGATLSVSYCLAPLATISHVMTTKSTESLPFALILNSVIFTSIWSLYGVIIQVNLRGQDQSLVVLKCVLFFYFQDSFVRVPNMMSLVVALFQLSLFACYPSTSQYKYTSVI